MSENTTVQNSRRCTRKPKVQEIIASLKFIVTISVISFCFGAFPFSNFLKISVRGMKSLFINDPRITLFVVQLHTS